MNAPPPADSFSEHQAELKTIVSIVIPCFNADRFVAAAITSALEQSFRNCEVVIVDDGSTDDSGKIIRSFGSKVRADFGPNRGASAARNRGTELARGDFIQYLDADDLLLPGTLARRVEALQQSGADVAYCDWQRLVETEGGAFQKGELVARSIESVHPDAEIALFNGFWSPPAALLYRRSIVDRIGGWNESLPIIQDARFLLDAGLRGGKFIRVPGIGAYYRVHRGQSLSRRSRVAFIRDCFHNAVQVQRHWASAGGVTAERREALIKALAHCSRGSFEVDKALFQEVHASLLELEPNYIPKGPRALKWVSRVCGYRNAEAVSVLYRRLKQAVLPK